MSLRVWLPLNGKIENQGIDNITTLVDNTNSFYDEGKISNESMDVSGIYKFFAPSIEKTNIFSVSFWYKPVAHGSMTTNWCKFLVFETLQSDLTTAGAIFRFESSYGLNENYCISIHNNVGEPIASIGRYLGTTWGEWQHITVTGDGTTLRCYCNGEFVLSGQMNGGVLSGVVWIGYTGTRPVGRMNDLRIYDHCLSLKEIKEIYKSLVLHIKMDGGGTANQNIAKDTLWQYRNETIKGLQPLNDDNITSFGWQLSEATGGSSQEIIFDPDATYNLQPFHGYAQITRNSTPHSSWGMLYYKWYDKYMIVPNTWYTVSFDVYSSLASGEINWYGICNTNALGHITDQTTRIPLQNKIKQNQWNRICASIKTLSENDFDWDTWYNSTPSQVIYFNLSTPLFVVNNVLRLRRLKLELGKTPTIWTPDYDVGFLNSYNPYDTRLPFADVSGYKHNTINLSTNTNFFNSNNEIKTYIAPRYSNPANMEIIQYAN